MGDYLIWTSINYHKDQLNNVIARYGVASKEVLEYSMFVDGLICIGQKEFNEKANIQKL